MASLVRRIEKQIMKRAGFTREKWVIERGPRGEPKLRNVKRGGEITDPDDNPIGRHWPDRIPARAKMQTQPAKRNRVLRALRRAKPNKKRLAHWANRVPA